MGSKDGKYPSEVYLFNYLWRKEMEENYLILIEKGFLLNKRKPTYHPLHTQYNECTITLECCTDLFLDPEDQNIIGQLLDTKNKGKEAFKIKLLPDK